MSDDATPITGDLPRPLSGIRVVEVGVWHAGPAIGSILADLGADVIKVESLGGDPERHFAAFSPMTDTRDVDTADWTVMFELSNRGKRGIALDLASTDGREVLLRLVGRADVFVTNLRPRSKATLGIDYASLSAVNPRLVHVNMTGFGAEGPMADTGAFDAVGQAISGMMFVAGAPDPQPLNVMVMDHLAAIVGSHATVTALLAREREGKGQEVTTSLYGAATWLMYANLAFTSVKKAEVDLSTWDRTARSPLRTTYRCGDGGWIMGTNHPEERHWPRFCAALGRPDLAMDERFATLEARTAAWPELYALLDEILASRPRDEWLEILTGHDLFFAPVMRFEDVLRHDQALVNGYVTDVEHPILGTVRMPGFPVRFGRHAAGPTGPAPGIGEHTREILDELGYGVDEVGALEAAGTTKAAGAGA